MGIRTSRAFAFANKMNALRAAPLGIGIAALLAASASAGSLAYKYDDFGRLIEVTYADGAKTTYTYDNANNRTEAQKLPAPSLPPQSTNFETPVQITLTTTGAYTGLQLVSSPNGAVTIGGTNTGTNVVTFTPASNFEGATYFIYNIVRSSGSEQKRVDITVNAQPQILVTADNSNLRAIANAAPYNYNGSGAFPYKFVVDTYAVVKGSPGGGTAISTGSWPSGVTVKLVVKGKVYGGGGNGGQGGTSPSPGSGGGNAIYIQAPTRLIISGGTIAGGGGGGGGGAETFDGATVLGGDGGGGAPNGLPGGSSTNNPPASAGSESGGGNGGSDSSFGLGAGGAGGGLNAPGEGGYNGAGGGGAGTDVYNPSNYTVSSS